MVLSIARSMALVEVPRYRKHADVVRRVLDRGRDPCAIVTVELPGVHGNDAVAALWQHGINTAATLRWFGLRDLTPRGIESAVRISPHYYNTANEVDTTVAALHEIIVRAAHGREHGATQ